MSFDDGSEIKPLSGLVARTTRSGWDKKARLLEQRLHKSMKSSYLRGGIAICQAVVNA